MEPDFDQMAWDMYFANLVGIQYHPANPIESRQPLEDLADIVDKMMEVRQCRSVLRLR